MTRAEYLAWRDGDEARRTAFREYYAQYVDEGVRSSVLMCVGTARLSESRDPHFNDIPIRVWDSIFPLCPARINELMRANGDYPTAAGLVCIAKEAARQIVESAS